MKVSGLPRASSLSGAEIAVSRSGQSLKTSPADLVGEGLPAAAGISSHPGLTHRVAALSEKLVFAITGSGGEAVAGLDEDLTWIVHGLKVLAGALDVSDLNVLDQIGVGLGGSMDLGGFGEIQARPTTKYPWALTGKNGKAVVALDDALTFIVHGLKVLGQLDLAGLSLEDLDVARGGEIRLEHGPAIQSRETDWAFAFTGKTGKVVFGIRKDGTVAINGLSTSDLFAQKDRNALGRSQAVMSRPHNAPIVPLKAARQLLVLYGQSLASSMEAWPALSKVARPDCFMIGASVRPNTAGGAGFTPIGGVALQPLVGTVDQTVSPRTAVLSDAEVAALAPGAGNEGEAPIVAVTNHVARAWDEQGWASPRKWVAVNTAVSGKTVEALSKGANPHLYQRNLDALTHHKTLADAAGESAACSLVAYMQGEYNYEATWGGTTDKATYKAKLAQMRSDFAADAIAATGQAAGPGWLLYQTSGSYVRDAVEMSVGMAQWEFARETPGVWLAGPVYPVTDKGGHLDANGSRWFGAQLAKIARRVLVDRLDWEPLAPLWIEQAGSTIYVGFHVPAPPLAFDLPYRVNAATDYPAKGFRVQDDAGYVGISSVEIVGATVVAIKCARTPGTYLGVGARVWAGDQGVHQGNVCLRDSDATRSDDVYEYLAGSGMYASADIAALKNKPYPLHNWCINFLLNVGWSRT